MKTKTKKTHQSSCFGTAAAPDAEGKAMRRQTRSAFHLVTGAAAEGLLDSGLLHLNVLVLVLVRPFLGVTLHFGPPVGGQPDRWDTKLTLAPHTQYAQKPSLRAEDFRPTYTSDQS